jgi:O-antigen/teichoic acid export membrane protein
MAATVPESLANAMVQLVHSRERSWLALRWVTIPAFGTLGLAAWLLTPIAGALGLAWAYVLAWVVALSGTSIIVRRLGIRPDILSSHESVGILKDSRAKL